MKTFDYLTVKEDKASLEAIYKRMFKTAEAGDFVNQRLVNATMNLKACIVEIEAAIYNHDIEERHAKAVAPTMSEQLDAIANALNLK